CAPGGAPLGVWGAFRCVGCPSAGGVPLGGWGAPRRVGRPSPCGAPSLSLPCRHRVPRPPAVTDGMWAAVAGDIATSCCHTPSENHAGRHPSTGTRAVIDRPAGLTSAVPCDAPGGGASSAASVPSPPTGGRPVPT